MRAPWLLGIAIASALASAAVLISLAVPGDTFGDTVPPLDSEPLPPRGIVTIDVRAGESAQSIGEKLEEADVVRSSRQFESLAALLGYADQLQAGTYDFEPGLSALQVLERIYGGVTSPRIVTIPEGRRLEEVAAILAANGVVGEAEFFRCAGGADELEWHAGCRSPAWRLARRLSFSGYLHFLFARDWRRGRSPDDRAP